MPILNRAITAALLASTPLLANAWMPGPPPGLTLPGFGYPEPPPPYGHPGMGPPGYRGALPWASRFRGPDSAPPGAQTPALEAGQSPMAPEAAGQVQPDAGVSGTPTPREGPAVTPPGALGPERIPADPPYGHPYGPMPPVGFGERPGMMPGRLRVQREVTDDAYLVHIQVRDGKTDDVQVTPLGRSLAISRSTDTQTLQEEDLDEGRGYRRSFSFSRGATSRRLGLPPDANPAAMTREEKDGTITLRIPRNAWRGPDLPPAQGGAQQGNRPGAPTTAIQAPGAQQP